MAALGSSSKACVTAKNHALAARLFNTPHHGKVRSEAPGRKPAHGYAKVGPMADAPESKNSPSANGPARPRLALRIGITGARSLDAGRLDHLREKLREVLGQARLNMLALAKEEDAAGFYAPGEGGKPAPPLLRLLSPLARGADRLAAEATLELGYELYVPMPFPQAEYEKDFTGTNEAKEPAVPKLSGEEDLAEFRALLERAGGNWLALDGGHGPEMNRAYESVGRFVVRNSDLLIAIWNGEPAAGRGGTEEIIHYAASTGVPVWWIDATGDREPVWTADIQDLRDAVGRRDPPQPIEPPGVRLRTYLERLIRPPAPVPRRSYGIIGRLARWRPESHVSPQAGYFAETPLPKRILWKAYGTLMRLASGHNPPWTPPRPPKDPVAAYWFSLYGPPDGRAGDYAARYRSCYVLIFVLATMALWFGAAALALHGAPEWAVVAAAVLEGAALAAIALLAGLALRRDWHERSIEYRLLAELCRKQQVLAPLGRAVPLGAARRMGAPGRAAWVAKLFAAYERAAPFPRGSMAAQLHGALKNNVLADLIDEQLQYHRDRAAMARGAGETFERWGAGSFFAVFTVVLLKIAATCAGWSMAGPVFGFLAIGVPAVSAAFVGIKSYAELQLLAEQSHHMELDLELAKARVERLDLGRPLASQDLGGEAEAVAALMLQDLEGWERLFRVKAIETQ
jgi:hypothetical protein